jgi:undecaprenyl-diphosphatase
MRLALVTQLIEWVRPFFATFGYAIVAAATFFESSAFTGLVVPGDVMLALGGVYAAQGVLDLRLVLGFGIVFGIFGESVGYLVGRRYGDGLLRRLPILRRFGSRIDEAERSIEAHAGKTIVLGRFVTGAASFVPFAAGASRVRPRRFFAFMIPTIVVWATAIALVGYLVGDNVERIDRILSGVGWFVLALAVLGVGIWWWRRRRRAEAGGATAPD